MQPFSRTGDVMQEGVNELKVICDSFADVQVSDRSMIWNTDLVETLELENLLQCAAVSIHGALKSRRKAVAHMPVKTFLIAMIKKWMKHTLATLNDDWTVSFEYRPVHTYTLTSEIDYIEPKARVY